jgi:hypothetical protein
MLPPEILIKRQDEVLRAIRSCRMPPELRGPLLAWVPASLSAAIQGTANLRQVNMEKSMRVRDGIHRAADAVLTERFRAVTQRRNWSGAVRYRLTVAHRSYGLEQRPCDRVIYRAMRDWIPPDGGAVDRVV